MSLQDRYKESAERARQRMLAGAEGTRDDSKQRPAAPEKKRPADDGAKRRSDSDSDSRPAWMISDDDRKPDPVDDRKPDPVGDRPRGGKSGGDRRPTGGDPGARVDPYVDPYRGYTDPKGPTRPAWPDRPAAAFDPAPEPEPTREEIEDARNRDAWTNPDGRSFMGGFLATDPVPLDEYQVRPGLSRWMYSLFHGVPFSRYPTGIRFVMRMDLSSDWERNVILYGNVFGGFLHKDSRVRVRGRLDVESGDLIADEVIHVTEPTDNMVAAQGLMSAGSVRLLTLLIVLALLSVIYGVVLLATGAASALTAIWVGLVAYLQVHWMSALLLVVAIGWLLRRTRRFRRRWRF